MSHIATYRETLLYATALAGNERLLAQILAVSKRRVADWIRGAAGIPESIYLKSVDVVLDATDEQREQAARFLLDR